MKRTALWNPIDNGLSVSGLNLWLQDKFAFEVSYLQNLEAVEPWSKEMSYGSLVQAGIEGWVKTGTKRGMLRFVQQEYKKQIETHGALDTIQWWSQLACHQCEQFVEIYDNDPHVPLSLIHTSERNVRVEITLPSERTITLNGYLDGEGDSILMENKVRGGWDVDSIVSEIKYDLQYNYYLLALLSESGKLPTRVWYQHSLRPGGFSYRGPRKKKTETEEEHLNRIVEHMKANPDTYFYRYIGRPTQTEVEQFCYACLYPMLEAFLDWYQYKVDQHLGFDPDNRVDWMTPYGLYNPFTQGTPEKFRRYRLTGESTGLRTKVR